MFNFLFYHSIVSVWALAEHVIPSNLKEILRLRKEEGSSISEQRNWLGQITCWFQTRVDGYSKVLCVGWQKGKMLSICKCDRDRVGVWLTAFLRLCFRGLCFRPSSVLLVSWNSSGRLTLALKLYDSGVTRPAGDLFLSEIERKVKVEGQIKADGMFTMLLVISFLKIGQYVSFRIKKPCYEMHWTWWTWFSTVYVKQNYGIWIHEVWPSIKCDMSFTRSGIKELFLKLHVSWFVK